GTPNGEGPSTALIIGISVGAAFLIAVLAVGIFARRKITSAVKNKEKFQRESSTANSSVTNSQSPPSSAESSQPLFVPVQMYNSPHYDSNLYVSHAPAMRSVTPNSQDGYNLFVTDGSFQNQSYNQYITGSRMPPNINVPNYPISNQLDGSNRVENGQVLGQPMYDGGSNQGSIPAITPEISSTGALTIFFADKCGAKLKPGKGASKGETHASNTSYGPAPGVCGTGQRRAAEEPGAAAVCSDAGRRCGEAGRACGQSR
ncbi:hypothetical protein HK096_010626, partial [Nowakowskiella sp. JEL0078]